ncbi:MAG TPA: glycosyltransferase family 2 protein [Phenylobacterium sp.]|jgi:hypothetical protein|uniref:glycosyltransferase family 2 protein n=1 Tax=Phenylobacterium sp. TaxID=1871053 RepID=UPI002C5B06AA|nr:glycosyltransferase family 2 protein [Phenylobacterium sp.]HXA39870.1 glycosyltransferase family 2 protein [Phenylobacterium sp.]
MPDAPVLSLCLATYNRARYLDRYLTHHLGLLDASGLDYELVVSDNCSTDETPQILARYAAQHSRMRVSRRPRNLGPYPNILTTLHQARGEVVVSIADDDMAIPDQLIAYVRRMIDDPALVMIQSPWLLTDETKGGAIVGKFYDFEGEMRFTSGQYGNCLAFVIQNHVFPECWLIRRAALQAIAGPMPRFTYGFFDMLAHALGAGDVLFSPEPHIAATAISEGGHVGNHEAMESWDIYRGGLEVMASYAQQFNPGDLPDASQVGNAILLFVCERMAVAARLQAHSRRWANTYELLRRLHAYQFRPLIDVDHDDVARLAAIETAFLECSQLGATQIVVGENIPEHIMELMTPIDGVRFIRADAVSPDDARRAYCQVGEVVDASMRPQDFGCDVVVVMGRFPIFPSVAA